MPAKEKTKAQFFEQWSSDDHFAMPEPYLPHRSYDPSLPPLPSPPRQLSLVTAQMLLPAPETAAEETHTVWLPTMRAQPERAAKPPRPAAAGEHPMWTAANEELSTKTLLPPEDTQDGRSSSVLLASIIALLVIRMRRRCAVQKRRVQAVPLSRKAPVDARKTMLSRYSAALLLLASPGAHANQMPPSPPAVQTTAWHKCCTHSSIRGGDMVHGAMNGGDNAGFSQAIAQAMCELLDTCAFVSWWGTAATSYGKKYSTRHTTLNTGVSRVTSGTDSSKARIFSRCRPELQPMHARRRAAH